MKEINESRREWILKQFIEEGLPLNRITPFKVWQDGNHPVKAGFVCEPQDYCYCSAIDFAGGKGYLELKLIR